MGVGGARVTAVHALHGEAVAGESVIGLIGYELFEHLAAGFLLVGHPVSRIIRGRKTGAKEVEGRQLKVEGKRKNKHREHREHRERRGHRVNGEEERQEKKENADQEDKADKRRKWGWE